MISEIQNNPNDHSNVEDFVSVERNLPSLHTKKK